MINPARAIGQQTVSYRDVYSLALPIAGVQLAGVALTTTDVLMLQTLGVVAIAGGGLAMQFYNQIRTMCVGMVTAGGNLVAEAASEWEKTGEEVAAERIRQAVRSCMAVGTATAIIGGLIVISFGALALILPIDDTVLDDGRACTRPYPDDLAQCPAAVCSRHASAGLSAGGYAHLHRCQRCSQRWIPPANKCQ